MGRGYGWLKLGCRWGEKSFLKYQEQNMVSWNMKFLGILSFWEYGERFDFNNGWGCAYRTLYIMRLLDHVYCWSLLICYPCSFYFMVCCWQLFGSENSFFLMTSEKSRNLPQVLIKPWPFLQQGDSTLSFRCKWKLDLKLVISIACRASFEKHCFDILKSIWFVKWVRLFSSFKAIW